MRCLIKIRSRSGTALIRCSHSALAILHWAPSAAPGKQSALQVHFTVRQTSRGSHVSLNISYRYVVMRPPYDCKINSIWSRRRFTPPFRKMVATRRMEESGWVMPCLQDIYDSSLHSGFHSWLSWFIYGLDFFSSWVQAQGLALAPDRFAHGLGVGFTQQQELLPCGPSGKMIEPSHIEYSLFHPQNALLDLSSRNSRRALLADNTLKDFIDPTSENSNSEINLGTWPYP